MNVTKPETKCSQLPVDESPKEGSPQKESTNRKHGNTQTQEKAIGEHPIAQS